MRPEPSTIAEGTQACNMNPLQESKPPTRLKVTRATPPTHCTGRARQSSQCPSVQNDKRHPILGIVCWEKHTPVSFHWCSTWMTIHEIAFDCIWVHLSPLNGSSSLQAAVSYNTCHLRTFRQNCQRLSFENPANAKHALYPHPGMTPPSP